MPKDTLSTLIYACNFVAAKGFCPATGGNFSMRMDANQMWMSASGKDKNQLKEEDFVTCDLEAKLISGNGKPSAEAFLHGLIYQLSDETSCVLHTHSVPVTVLSMLKKDVQKLLFQGYEMQKTIDGFHSHEETLKLFIFDNDQDIPRLASGVKEMWNELKQAHGFIVRGHGLYSWGNSVAQARRHMEGLEFLVECELYLNRLKKHD